MRDVGYGWDPGKLGLVKDGPGWAGEAGGYEVPETPWRISRADTRVCFSGEVIHSVHDSLKQLLN